MNHNFTRFLKQSVLLYKPEKRPLHNIYLNIYTSILNIKCLERETRIGIKCSVIQKLLSHHAKMLLSGGGGAWDKEQV